MPLPQDHHVIPRRRSADEQRAEAVDSDAALRVARGDRDAAALLYQRHSARARHAALLIVHSAADADDVVQDAFLAFLARPWMFVPERGDFSSWFRRTVRNAALDRARKRSRHRTIEDDMLRHEQTDVSMEEAPYRVSSGELDRIHAALARLSTARQLVVDAAFRGGLTHGEIAQRNGIPLGTVKGRLYRAVRALRRELESADIGDAPQSAA